MINSNDGRLEQLRALAETLADKINDDPGARDLAGLAKQLRETLREIEEIEGVEDDDEISKLLKGRGFDGESGTDRKDCSELSAE